MQWRKKAEEGWVFLGDLNVGFCSPISYPRGSSLWRFQMVVLSWVISWNAHACTGPCLFVSRGTFLFYPAPQPPSCPHPNIKCWQCSTCPHPRKLTSWSGEGPLWEPEGSVCEGHPAGIKCSGAYVFKTVCFVQCHYYFHYQSVSQNSNNKKKCETEWGDDTTWMTGF